MRNVSFAIIIFVGLFIWMYESYPSMKAISYDDVLITMLSPAATVKQKQKRYSKTNYDLKKLNATKQIKNPYDKTNNLSMLYRRFDNDTVKKSKKELLFKLDVSRYKQINKPDDKNNGIHLLSLKVNRNISVENITVTLAAPRNDSIQNEDLSYAVDEIQEYNNSDKTNRRETERLATTIAKSVKNFKEKMEFKTKRKIITVRKRSRFKDSYEERYRPWLKQVIKQKHVKQSRRNIFFVESSCGTTKLRRIHSTEEGLVLNARQSCAIESTARTNRKYNIFLFHTCEIDNAFYELSSNYVRELFNYPNVYLVKVNMNRLFNATPLQDMWNNKAFEESSYPLEHISDAMRLLILWKYGGTYLDLDVITMRSLTSLKSNFAGVQDDETIANGVLNFEPNGFAHSVLTTCLENFRDWFDGKDWSSNGPILLTNALLEFCQVSEVVQVMKSRCNGFHLYPPSVFYPVHFSDWESFLDEGESQRIMKQIENSTIVHMWNRLSHDGYVSHGSNQAFSILADKYCPRVYQEVGPNFRK
ncbi:lactosylceramide 4-alpha-galactosyltransferase-like [Lycorma delicatula]|uniref:lactosylceramide 4-alpha-galactosyltransferase-like n=1 Tax=Lycorma delicatula TaxID=130591 RepID=UPI003F51A6D5